MIKYTNSQEKYVVHLPKISAEDWMKKSNKKRIGRIRTEDIVGGKGKQSYVVVKNSYINEGQQILVIEKSIRVSTNAPEELKGKVGQVKIKYYYWKVVQKDGKQTGNWKYGESCPNFDIEILSKLHEVAIKEGTIELSDIIPIKYLK